MPYSQKLGVIDQYYDVVSGRVHLRLEGCLAESPHYLCVICPRLVLQLCAELQSSEDGNMEGPSFRRSYAREDEGGEHLSFVVSMVRC